MAIETIEADLKDYQIEPGSWQAIVSIFCHLPPLLRTQLHRKVCAGLRPGGMFILEGYSKRQIDLDTGGPRHVDLLLELGDLLQELDGLTFSHALETEREIHEGRYHNGTGAVVQLIGTRPQ